MNQARDSLHASDVDTHAEAPAAGRWIPVPDTSMLPVGEAPPRPSAGRAASEPVGHLRAVGGAQAEALRAAVRRSPLACMAAAFALGGLIARLVR